MGLTVNWGGGEEVRQRKLMIMWLCHHQHPHHYLPRVQDPASSPSNQQLVCIVDSGAVRGFAGNPAKASESVWGPSPMGQIQTQSSGGKKPLGTATITGHFLLPAPLTETTGCPQEQGCWPALPGPKEANAEGLHLVLMWDR